MKYKSPRSDNGVLIFVVPALFVVFGVVLLVSNYPSYFNAYLEGGASGHGLAMAMTLLLLGAAALMGVVLAIGHFTGNRPPLYSVGMVHGIVATLGVIFLTISVINGTRGTDIQFAFIIFLVTVALGIVFFFLRRVRKVIPNSLIVVHALLAVVGYVFLLRG